MAAKRYLIAGDLVPSDITNALVRDRISQTDCRRYGFILHNRFRVYRQQTAKLLAHYHNKLITVDGVGSIDEVFTRALRALRR
jgi:adenylate kinase family enzyme